MKIQILHTSLGFSLFELVMVMVIISILATASLRYMGNSVDISKTEETKEELNEIANGIIGNESHMSGNHQSDFGYVGDVGSLPSSLNDLVVNPGFATWDGPYIHDNFYVSSGATESEFLVDGWGKSYSFNGGTSISSTGGSTTITKVLANSSSELLQNEISFNVVDLGGCPPGASYKDSILFNYTYPNGSGGYQTVSKAPSQNGFVTFSSLPIGQHTLRVVELTNNDTLFQKIEIDKNSSSHIDIQMPIELWCDTTALAEDTTGSGGGSGVEILRPNGSGSINDLLDENCSTNWQCVDETSADGEGTYVKGEGNGWNYDLYNIENTSIGTGTIDSIIVYIYVQGNGGNQKASTYIKTNGITDEGSQITPSSSFSIYSNTYIHNPQTSSAWTWTEIDALQIGAGLKREAKLTQTWVEVYYTN